jgi:hypothetical protein
MTKKTGISTVRTVGDKKIFIQRLQKVRSWLLKRNMVVNTFLIHNEIAKENNGHHNIQCCKETDEAEGGCQHRGESCALHLHTVNCKLDSTAHWS